MTEDTRRKNLEQRGENYGKYEKDKVFAKGETKNKESEEVWVSNHSEQITCRLLKIN